MNRTIPPVFVFVVAIAAIYCVDDVISVGKVEAFEVERMVIAALCFVCSGLFGVLALWTFKKASTTVNPVEVNKARTVVSSGVFRLSRNPMYLGLLLLLLCYSFYLGNLWGIVICCLFILYMNRFQILAEELAMEHKFGQEYRDYKARVRRWI